MLLRKISYILLEITALFFYILFVGDISFYIFVFVSAFPFVLLGILICARIFISCDISTDTPTAEKGQECEYRLNIRNRCIFPFPKTRLTIYCDNIVTNERKKFRINVPVSALSEQTLAFAVVSDNCGVLYVKAASLRVFDYISLFSVRIGAVSDAETLITPIILYSGSIEEQMKLSDDSDRFSKRISGDDPSEIFELKEYTEGDRLNRIHWNLSSLRNTLVTKHYSQGISSPAAVIPDIDLLGFKDEMDAVLDIFFSIACAFLEIRGDVTLLMPNSGAQVRVTNMNELLGCYREFITEYEVFDGLEEAIDKCVAENASVYYVTNRPFDEQHILNVDSDASETCFFVDSAFTGVRISNAYRVKIIKTDPASAKEALTKGL